MAKKKEKTLEEKLQEALVPENQWPYILPENWCWTKGKYILEKMESQKPEGDYFYYIDIDAIDNSCQIVTEPKQIAVCDAPSRASRKIHVGDTIFSLVRPYLKNIAYIDKSLSNSIASTGFYVCTPKKNVFPKFFYWLMISPYVVDGLNKYMKGDNSPSIRGGDIEGFCYPIPPLPEQKRIVYRIESLFAKLDEAKEKIQQVLDGAEMRKAAILHKAFTGELTKTWRRENNITTTDDVNREKLSKECEEYDIPYEIPDEWRWVTFNEVCTFIGSGVTPKGGQAVYTDSGIPFIRSQNVLNGKLDLSDVAYISDEINEKMKRTQIIGGETLLNITGASIGRSCYVPQEQSVGNVNQHVCILRFKNYINGYIPQLWLNSPKMQEFINFNQVGQTRQALNFKQIRGIYFPLPPLQEQLEMVRIIKYEINKLDVVCNSLANLAVRIDTMKKSILAKAFRGELGTNNPNEDSALNLLKEVLQDKF
ncbi:MAG: restriction endonuclease subunit S [Veillonellaceae bacterium]|nr:restriction endonuclease subunit S [Veillonellaceae bacterium]